MANESKIQVIITADASGAVTGIKMAGDATEQLATRTQSFAQKIKAHWLEVTAGVTAAYMALQQAWGYMEKAAQAQEAMATLGSLTREYGESAEGMVARIQEASSGLIGLRAAASTANDALIKGFTPEQIEQLASWSVTLSHASGGAESAADTFKSLEASMVAGRERGAVKLLGTTIDLTQKFGEFATTMSKAEKAQAIFTMAQEQMAKVQKAIGTEADSAADKMERFKIQVEGVQRAVGDFLLRLSAGLLATFQSVAALALWLTRVLMAPITALMTATDYLGITTGKSEEYLAKMEELGQASLYTAQQATENYRLMREGLAEGTTGGIGGLGGEGIDESTKRLEQLAQMRQKYRKEEEAASVAESDRELASVNAWFNAEVEALDKLKAKQSDYDAMYAAYSAKWDKANQERDAKIAEEYSKWMTKRNEEELKADIELRRLQIEQKEKTVREEMALDEMARKAGWGDESAWIQAKGESERKLLELQQEKVLLKMDEAKTEEDLFNLSQELLGIQNQIAASKTKEAFELDLRRYELQEKITDLTRQQQELLLQGQIARATTALGKIEGTSDLSGYVSDASSLAGGMQDITTGTDAYSVEFQKWSALQDQKIQALEESEASQEAIREAYRQYDLQQEAALQQQKIALTSTALGTMSSLAEGIYNLTGQKGGAAFEAMKAFKIAETVINTYSAAVGAFNALCWIPLVGPALGAAAAAAAIAFGLAQVNAIRSMKPGSSSTSGSSVYLSSSSTGTTAASTSGESTSSTTEQATQTIVNVTVLGNIVDQDVFARELIPSITKALGDNVQ